MKSMYSILAASKIKRGHRKNICVFYRFMGLSKVKTSVNKGHRDQNFFLLTNTVRQGSAIANFENVLFNMRKKCDFKIGTFFAHLVFSKERLCYRTFCRTFEKCEKSEIAQSLFRNERMCENVGKSANFKIPLFCTLKRSHKLLFQKERMCKNVQNKCKKMRFQNSHIFAHLLFSKERLCDHTFSKSDKKCDRTFAHFKIATKCAMAHLHIFKERQNV